MLKIGISVMMIGLFISTVYFANSIAKNQENNKTIQDKEVMQIYIVGFVDKPGRYLVNDTFTVSQLLRENDIKLIQDDDVSREPCAATYNSGPGGQRSTYISKKNWDTLPLKYTPEAILTIQNSF
jgi:hypothetical protein